MFKQILLFGTCLLFVSLTGHAQLRAAPLQLTAKQLNYERQFKPLQISPAVRVPTRAAAKEVGGIQSGRHVDVKLADGTTVRCFPAATNNPERPSKNYYYLPTNPHISRDEDGTPKFSMVRFVTDKTKAQGGVDGAILDIMVEYGLSPEQVKEVEKQLRKKVKGAKLKGAVQLEPGAEGNSFHVISATLTDKGFTNTLVTSGKAPVMEGQRVAMAARLSEYGATLLERSMEQPTTDISVVFDLKYLVKLPAYDVSVKINFDTYNEMQKEYEHNREKTTKHKRYWDPKWYNPFHIGTRKTTVLSETEKLQMIELLKEKGVVTFENIVHVPEADKEIVESGLHQLVLEAFFDMQKRFGQPSAEEVSGEDEDESDNEIEKARREEASKAKNYSYTVYQRKVKQSSGTITLELKKSIARYEYYTMTGNVGAWYEKHKDNPDLVTEVNLDDPFFQRREMRFVIDNEAYDIFKKMVNYATVQVRVPREGQRPFIDELTIDKKYLEKSGQTATLTYARMGDDAQTYDYAVQWSLRGGYLYPAKPQWAKGELMAVTLTAPVTPLVIEAEADLDEFDELGIARATVELRYDRFGKKYRDQKGLALSPAIGEPVVDKVIYHDSEKGNIQYRLVFHTKKAGKLTDNKWHNLEGAYIYCSPSELVVNKLKDLL
jgi:hypothetical protein